jgi:hypothetical protein
MLFSIQSLTFPTATDFEALAQDVPQWLVQVPASHFTTIKQPLFSTHAAH